MYELGTLPFTRPLQRGVRTHTPELSEADSVPCHTLSGASRPSVTPDRRALPEAASQDAAAEPAAQLRLP